jgi:hypothetical protein
MSVVLLLIHLPHIINTNIITIHHDTMTTAGVVLQTLSWKVVIKA